MHVLRRFREAVVSGGSILDLQVIRPQPRIETEGRLLHVADGSPLFEGADTARADCWCRGSACCLPLRSKLFTHARASSSVAWTAKCVFLIR